MFLYLWKAKKRYRKKSGLLPNLPLTPHVLGVLENPWKKNIFFNWGSVRYFLTLPLATSAASCYVFYLDERKHGTLEWPLSERAFLNWALWSMDMASLEYGLFTVCWFSGCGRDAKILKILKLKLWVWINFNWCHRCENMNQSSHPSLQSRF